MKLQETPEEIEDAKVWWAEQKRELIKNIRKQKRKTQKQKKIRLLLALKAKKEMLADTK